MPAGKVATASGSLGTFASLQICHEPSEMKARLSSRDTQSKRSNQWLSLIMHATDHLGLRFSTMNLKDTHAAPRLRERRLYVFQLSKPPPEISARNSWPDNLLLLVLLLPNGRGRFDA